MRTRLDLQSKLVELLGSNHVYYQPPESLKMEYPCIRYSKSVITNKPADNVKYLSNDSYQIIVIDKRPDNAVIKKILDLPYASYDRHYVSNNLNHDVIIIHL